MGKYVKFNQQAYINDVRAAIMREINNLSPLIVAVLRKNLGSVTFREVDAKYKAAAMESIHAHVYQRANSFITSIGAGGGATQQNQAFRAVYYNYGTGNLMRPPAKFKEGVPGGWGGWNTARKGRDIYQRPRGTWFDLGGNPHTSKLRGEPRKLANKGLGREIEPTFWYEESLKEIVGMFDTAVHKAVKGVPLSAYIGIRSIQKRM